MAAGALLVQEAGGAVLDPSGKGTILRILKFYVVILDSCEQANLESDWLLKRWNNIEGTLTLNSPSKNSVQIFQITAETAPEIAKIVYEIASEIIPEITKIVNEIASEIALKIVPEIALETAPKIVSEIASESAPDRFFMI